MRNLLSDLKYYAWLDMRYISICERLCVVLLETLLWTMYWHMHWCVEFEKIKTRFKCTKVSFIPQMHARMHARTHTHAHTHRVNIDVHILMSLQFENDDNFSNVKSPDDDEWCTMFGSGRTSCARTDIGDRRRSRCATLSWIRRTREGRVETPTCIWHNVWVSFDKVPKGMGWKTLCELHERIVLAIFECREVAVLHVAVLPRAWNWFLKKTSCDQFSMNHLTGLRQFFPVWSGFI